MTKHLDEEDRFARGKDLTDDFKDMHLFDHAIINPGLGHGYCQICDVRYCCNADRSCFSKKIRDDVMRW